MLLAVLQFGGDFQVLINRVRRLSTLNVVAPLARVQHRGNTAAGLQPTRLAIPPQCNFEDLTAGDWFIAQQC